MPTSWRICSLSSWRIRPNNHGTFAQNHNGIFAHNLIAHSPEISMVPSLLIIWHICPHHQGDSLHSPCARKRCDGFRPFHPAALQITQISVVFSLAGNVTGFSEFDPEAILAQPPTSSWSIRPSQHGAFAQVILAHSRLISWRIRPIS